MRQCYESVYFEDYELRSSRATRTEQNYRKYRESTRCTYDISWSIKHDEIVINTSLTRIA